MTEQSIGTARLDLVVDKSTAEASITSFQRSVSGMSTAAQAEFNRLDAATKRYATSLIKQADTMGLARDQQIAYNAQMRIGGVLGDEIAKKARAQAVAQKELAAAQERSALIQAEATRRIQQETAARERNWQQVRATLADQKRLDQMRQDATHAFSVELAARERAQLGAAREAGVRERLSNLLSTERGQRILAAQATTQHAAATAKAAAEFNKYGLSAKQQTAALRQVPVQLTDIFTSLAAGQRPLTVLLQQGGQLRDIFGGAVPAIRAMGGALLGLINPFTVATAAIVAIGLAWKSAADEQANFEKALILTGNQADLTGKQLRDMASSLDATTNATSGKASEVLAKVAATGKFTAEQIRQVAEAAINLEDATGRAVEQTIRDFVELQKDPVEAIKRLNDAVGDGTNVVGFLTPEVRKSIEALKDQGAEARATAEAVDVYADAINSASPQVIDKMSGWTKAWRDIKFGINEATDAVKDFFRESAASQFAAQSFRNLLPFRAPEPAAAPISGRRQGPIPKTPLDGMFSIPGANQSQFSAVPLVVDFRPPAPARSGGGGSRGGGVGVRSVRELPDFSKNAAAELQRLVEAETRASEAFKDLQAELQGPLAVAMRDHEKQVAQINELAAQSPTAMAGLNDALALEEQRHKENVAAIEAQLDPLGQLLDDMALELELIGKSNAERAVMLELRRNNIDAMSAEGQAALATARAFEDEAAAKQRSIDLMDDFRQGASNALTDIVTGAKSAKEAFADFFDDLARRITQMIAEKWIEKAFGAMGSDGSGTQGGGWISAIASLFANANGNAFQNGNVMAFANGGVVGSPTLFPMRNGMGLMGEAGPEAIVPLHRGPDGKLGIRMERESPSRQVTVQQSIYVTGTVSPYAASQMQQEAARKQRIVTSRNG